jgi:hypothetical protein
MLRSWIPPIADYRGSESRNLARLNRVFSLSGRGMNRRVVVSHLLEECAGKSVRLDCLSQDGGQKAFGSFVHSQFPHDPVARHGWTSRALESSGAREEISAVSDNDRTASAGLAVSQ